MHKLIKRVARFLTKQGLLTEDSGNRYLNLDKFAPDPMQDLHGHSITYRVATKSGMALGSDRLKSELASLTDRRLHSLPPEED